MSTISLLPPVDDLYSGELLPLMYLTGIIFLYKFFAEALTEHPLSPELGSLLSVSALSGPRKRLL
jgi:hypothetical protein